METIDRENVIGEMIATRLSQEERRLMQVIVGVTRDEELATWLARIENPAPRHYPGSSGNDYFGLRGCRLTGRTHGRRPLGTQKADWVCIAIAAPCSRARCRACINVKAMCRQKLIG